MGSSVSDERLYLVVQRNSSKPVPRLHRQTSFPLLAIQTKPNTRSLFPSFLVIYSTGPGSIHSGQPHLKVFGHPAPKMQRQHGLSSPVPKLQQDGCSDAFEQMALTEEESSASSSKADKARLLREERSIHLIPLLTFLCFLLLFLCSHDPSAAGKFHPLACIRLFLDQSIYTSCIFLFFPPKICRALEGSLGTGS
jgi:hypothetical protein